MFLQDKGELELRSSLSVPSTVNSYSMAVEYIKNWFLSKFDESYFKTIYINDKHILDDFRNFDKTKDLKKLKPSLAITPIIDLAYDRDGLDTYLYSIDSYLRKGRLDPAFFKDKKKNMYLDLRLEQMRMEFTFKLRVSTRAQQIDLYKFLELAFRIGATQSDEIDMDFHIPYTIILQIARDAGFEIVDDKIVNVLEFVSYLNEHSTIPILYKYRTINGKNEFFVRLKEMYVHISCLDKLSFDDGEREGQISTNYIIEMNCVLTIPAPKLYSYYSDKEHDILKIESSNSDNIGLFNIKIPKIPETNDKGWQVYMTTECYEEDITKPLSLDFKELIENSDLEKVIDYHIDTYLSPSIFIDFKLFNNGDEVEYDIDWRTLTICTKECLKDKVTSIIIYIDLKYMADCNIQINEMYKSRIK